MSLLQRPLIRFVETAPQSFAVQRGSEILGSVAWVEDEDIIGYTYAPVPLALLTAWDLRSIHDFIRGLR